MENLIGITNLGENFDIDHQEVQNCSLFLEDTHYYEETVDFNSGHFINTHKLYKTWFNKDPDIFLPEINQLRLIEFRKANPKAEISLLYSIERLSIKAKEDLKSFSDAYCIKAVDIDEILIQTQNATELNSESKILSLAKEELDNFNKGNKGGNPAAASDLLRVSKTVIEKLGIYSDFDVQLIFDSFPVFLKINTPIIVPHNNNDFMAFSCSEKCKSISLEAEKQLAQIQEAIIKSYDSYINEKHLGFFNKNNSITEFRTFIKKFDAHNLFRYYHNLDYRYDIFDFNKENSEKIISMLDNLTKEEIVELFLKFQYHTL